MPLHNDESSWEEGLEHVLLSPFIVTLACGTWSPPGPSAGPQSMTFIVNNLLCDPGQVTATSVLVVDIWCESIVKFQQYCTWKCLA